MRQPSLTGIISPFLLLFFICFSFLQSHGQTNLKGGIDWNTDTLSSNAASSSATRFRTDLNNAGRKATKIITLQVDKLKEIMDACYSNGVTDIKVLIIMLRVEDTARYSKRNPGMTAAEKRDIIGRQTIVLKVPRRAFGSSQSGSGININRNNPLMLSLLAAGMFVLDKPVENITMAEGDIYFELGLICPPPTSCDN